MGNEREFMDIQEILKDLYKDVTEWLKFAEAKNGILLTVTGVLLFGFLKLSPSEIEWLKQLKNTILLSSWLLIINMLIILYSFVPRLNIRNREKKAIMINNINLLFYKDIFYLKKEEYIEQLEKKYNIEISSDKKMFIYDQVEQILSLAQIAVIKYKFFTFGVKLVGLSLLIILVKVFFMYLG